MNQSQQAASSLLTQKIKPGPRSTVAKLAMDATREVDELRIREFNLYVKSVKYQFSTGILFFLCIVESVMLYLR